MTTESDFQSPLGTSGSQAALRVALQARLIYFIPVSEDPTGFVAVDPVTGAQPPCLAYNGALFFFDSADTTTVHDGLTCIVTNDGKRYKTDGGAPRVDSVLDVLTAPPGSPALGDAYLVDSAATGAFATHDDDIAIYTARGWEFQAPSVGMILYIEDIDAYFHYNAAGAWIGGFGDAYLTANSVTPAAILGGRSHYIVESNTVTVPPAITAGAMYIVGPSATGAWAGQDAKIAIGNAAADDWIFVTPTNGYTAFIKALNSTYIFNGTAWASQAGSYVSRYLDILNASTAHTIESGGNTGGTVGYVYSDTTPPKTTDVAYALDTYQPTIAAKRAGAVLEIDYWARVQFQILISGSFTGGGKSAGWAAIGLFVDSETDARDWVQITNTTSAVNKGLTGWSGTNGSGTFTSGPSAQVENMNVKKLMLTLADTNDHVLKFRFFFRLSAAGDGSQITLTGFSTARRRVVIREGA